MKLFNMLFLLVVINCNNNNLNLWIVEDIIHLNTEGFLESDLDEVRVMKNKLIGTKVIFSNQKLSMDECKNSNYSNIYCFNKDDFKFSEIKKAEIIDNYEKLRVDYKIQGNEMFYRNMIGRDFFKNFGIQYKSNDIIFTESNIAIIEEEGIYLKILFIDNNKVILLGIDFAILLNKIS
ncbi:hypothetical protein SAMN04488096_10435 [Mesonia phycicola]|uniref:Uncharacterized protein n=1 Tax=Mesonia phycicola TaxID=579105 RepID=A0A1M6DKF7_9FLAO|nr:hypothetical protein [Mesonia phycicola]SHI73468.1 hypothetical protein SAMN04488096_10435 [Mesonia phycicola]